MTRATCRMPATGARRWSQTVGIGPFYLADFLGATRSVGGIIELLEYSDRLA